MSELALWFAKSQGQIQLERTVYVDPSGTEIVAVRGKYPGAYKGAGVFQWTPGVQALAVVFLTALTRHLKQINTFLPLLEGEKGGLAFSLYYALAKQPEWLFEMFGSDEDGNARLRKILFQSNLSTGKVALSLNEQILLPHSIRVCLADVELRSAEEVEYLLHVLTDGEKSDVQQEMRNSWTLLKSKDLAVTQRSNLRPAAVSCYEPDSIYLFEQLQFPSNSIADRLSWDQRDVNGQRPPAICGRIVQAKYIFEELTYRTCDERTKTQFEDWLASMTVEKDGEYGRDRQLEGESVPGFLSWVREHNASDAFTADSLYDTFIWRDRVSKDIVATTSIVPDDRGVKANYGLKGIGFLGGHNVRSDLRSRGIGKYIYASVNHRISEYARNQGKSISVHLFTRTFGPLEPIAKLLKYLEFAPDPIAIIRTSQFGVAPLWSKTYSD